MNIKLLFRCALTYKLRALHLPVELFHSEIREKGKDHHIQRQFLPIPIDIVPDGPQQIFHLHPDHALSVESDWNHNSIDALIVAM